MANCTTCGKKLGLFEQHHKFEDGRVMCRSCYEMYEREQEKIKRERQEAYRRRRVREKKERAAEKRKRTIEKEKKELEEWKKLGIGKIIERLGHTSPDKRADAAFILGKLGDKKAVRPLLEVLKDEYYEVVRAAAESLGKIGDPRALDDLRKLYNSRWPGDSKVRKSIEKLNKIKFERIARVAETNLKGMSWQDFEDAVTEALNAVASDTRTSDMGIDGITSKGIPIQIKQSERIGRNVVDNFETALRRYYPATTKNIKGILVAFSFSKGAYTEADRAKREDNIDIQLLTADELID